jgi:hypothetical protein
VKKQPAQQLEILHISANFCKAFKILVKTQKIHRQKGGNVRGREEEGRVGAVLWESMCLGRWS